VRVIIRFEMYIVVDKAGKVYGEGDCGAEAITSAINVYSPDRRRKVRRAIWEAMKAKGFRLEESVWFPSPFKKSTDKTEKAP